MGSVGGCQPRAAHPSSPPLAVIWPLLDRGPFLTLPDSPTIKLPSRAEDLTGMMEIKKEVQQDRLFEEDSLN